MLSLPFNQLSLTNHSAVIPHSPTNPIQDKMGVGEPKNNLHLFLRSSEFYETLKMNCLNQNSNPKNLKPLKKVFEILTQEINQEDPEQQAINQSIQKACKKESGYLSRFFSKESWADWTEDKTALGKVVSLYIDYAESSTPMTRFKKRLDFKLIEEATDEAVKLLSSLKSKKLAKIDLSESKELPSLNDKTSIDVNHNLYQSAQSVLNLFDSELSKMLTFFPGVGAVSVSDSDSIALVRPEEYVKAVKIYTGLNMNAKGMSDLIDRLDNDLRISFIKDPDLMERYFDFKNNFTEIASYVYQKGQQYIEYKKNVQKMCNDIQILEENLEWIEGDLREKKGNSDYAPTKKKEVVLTFPVYSEDYKKEFKGGCLVEVEKNDRSILPSIKSIITPNSKFKDEICDVNPVEIAILMQLKDAASILKLFDINSNCTFDQFKEMFGKDAVKTMQIEFIRIKELLDKGVVEVEKIVKMHIENLDNEIRKNINNRIRNIYNHQREIADAKKLSFSADVEGSNVLGWDVEEIKPNQKSELLFRFRIGDTISLVEEKYENIAKFLKNIGIPSEGASGFIKKLSLRERRDLDNNRNLQNNIEKFGEVYKKFIEFARPIFADAKNFDQQIRDIRKVCMAIKTLEEKLDWILEDLQDKFDRSDYSPTKKTTLVLTPPEYSDNLKKLKNDRNDLYKIDKVTFGQNSKKSVSFEENAIKKIEENAKNHCSKKPVRETLLKLKQLNIFSEYNISNEWDYKNRFLEKFKNDSISEFDKKTESVRDDLNKIIARAEKIVEEYKENLRQCIDRKIKKIHSAHVNMIDNSELKINSIEKEYTIKKTINGKLQEVKEKKFVGWDVFKEGTVWNDNHFKIRLGDYNIWKDEL